MLRITMIVVFVVLFLILSIPILLVEWCIGLVNKRVKYVTSKAIIEWAFRVCLFFAGTKVTVIGRENIPKDRAVLYIGNHRSVFDILISYVNSPRPTGYIAKDELIHVPLLNLWMRNINCLFLDRKDVKKGLKTILTSIEKLKSGVSICIFPEGTRNNTDKALLPFHDGSFKPAIKAKCPIVPMTFNNASAIFEDQYPRIKKAHVILEFGKPFMVDDLEPEDKKHIGEYTANIIRETYERNKSLV